MKLKSIISGMAIGFVLISCVKNEKEPVREPLKYPATEKSPVTDTLHGNLITDNYRWLEDKTDPKVRKWSEEQHAFTLNYINKNGDEIEGLKSEIKAYFDRDYRSSPFYIGKREFFFAKKKGQQHNVLYTVIDKKEIKIFDPMDLDNTGNTSWGSYDFTESGDKVAIGTQFKGNEINAYRLYDTKTGAQQGEPITGLRGFSFCKDESKAYITVGTKEMIDKQEPLRTYLHTLGTDRSHDVFLIAPKDAKNFAAVEDSKESDLTFFSEGDFYSGSISIRKQGTNDKPKVIYSSTEFQASPTVKNGKIFFFTNDNAPNYKIMVTDIDKPEYKNWTDFYPEKETVLESYCITSDYVLIQYKKDVLKYLDAYDLNGKFVKTLKLPEFGDVSGISYNKELNSVIVSLSTFTSPAKMYKLDGKSLSWSFLYQDNPPIKTDGIESRQVFYKSKDGTKIPMFICYKKGMELDGSNPTLLYGYGGFQISLGPSYLGDIASFINRGGIYAVANLRGGDEYGESWHKGGMLEKKQNVFDDFISAAEYLIKEKYTNPQKLAISGRSNGGLLTGAVMVQRPDLFKAVVVGVPLLDMLRYHKFLIARYWIPEYGDAGVPENYPYIRAYSPYHNIREGVNYPAAFIAAGENDTRVDPLHAKKFAAALQNNPGQKNPILLFVDFDAGHGSGGSGQSVNKRVENRYTEWKFIYNELGIK